MHCASPHGSENAEVNSSPSQQGCASTDLQEKFTRVQASKFENCEGSCFKNNIYSEILFAEISIKVHCSSASGKSTVEVGIDSAAEVTIISDRIYQALTRPLKKSYMMFDLIQQEGNYH